MIPSQICSNPVTIGRISPYMGYSYQGLTQHDFVSACALTLRGWFSGLRNNKSGEDAYEKISTQNLLEPHYNWRHFALQALQSTGYNAARFPIRDRRSRV